MTALVEYGHSYREVLRYTPRMIDALLWSHEKRRRSEMANALANAFIAARAAPKDVESQMRKLIRGR